MGLAIATGLWFAYSGMIALCLGLERHYKQVWGLPPSLSLRRALRGSGWLALAASFAASVAAWGWAMGPIGGLGLVSLAGLALVLVLPYQPRLAIGTAVAGWPVLALATLAG
ncbi:DUF3325 domain-containing protein [Pseudomonas sp. BW16M2]|uniref:DUF3325 domain-containing protein n=1 Tax=Pseudomonas sp. BW16M2 TaxID=2745489 RepID=UPI0016451C90|nr:DUF3325 domain-containing protein [Pseudomonas sp. BW16M2]MBC3434534.1 DUF3325 domain-containing protein [Pseudomonas sp. BW16M2]